MEKKIAYTGIILNKDSHAIAMNMAIENGHTGWKLYAHHCTLCMGRLENLDMLGTEVSMIVDAIGENADALALSVILPNAIIEYGNFKKTGRRPHVTLSVAPGGKPADSNKIIKWKLTTRVVLTGTIQEVEYFPKS